MKPLHLLWPVTLVFVEPPLNILCITSKETIIVSFSKPQLFHEEIFLSLQWISSIPRARMVYAMQYSKQGTGKGHWSAQSLSRSTTTTIKIVLFRLLGQSVCPRSQLLPSTIDNHGVFDSLMLCGITRCHAWRIYSRRMNECMDENE